MTVKSKLQFILDEISEFENWVGNIDSQLGLKNYYIHMPSLVIPYSIEVRLSADHSVVASFEVNYDDIILPGKFNDALQNEWNRVQGIHDLISIAELQKIKEAFDF